MTPLPTPPRSRTGVVSISSNSISRLSAFCFHARWSADAQSRAHYKPAHMLAYDAAAADPRARVTEFLHRYLQ